MMIDILDDAPIEEPLSVGQYIQRINDRFVLAQSRPYNRFDIFDKKMLFINKQFIAIKNFNVFSEETTK
jgi:hypothetical protein